ncbi:MAG: hypothetical protein ABI567_05740 [Gammaproteobacteria bacterium]
MDTMLITAANPNLAGQSGIMTGSMMVHVSPPTTVALSNSTDPGVNVSTEVLWSLGDLSNASTPGVFMQQKDTDESAVASIYNDGTNGLIASPAPATVIVPVTITFNFRQAFE